jgi:hypothetical protein
LDPSEVRLEEPCREEDKHRRHGFADPNDSDILITYEGCGCAGGLVTTIEGELVPRTDTSGSARRKQKAYSDILGRTWKTETFEWDGSTEPFIRIQHNRAKLIIDSG